MSDIFPKLPATVSQNSYVLKAMKSIFLSKKQKSNLYFSYKVTYCNGHQPYLFTDAYIDFKFPPSENRREETTAISLEDLICNVFDVIKLDVINGIRIERPLPIDDDRWGFQKESFACLIDFMEAYQHHEKCIGKISHSDSLTETIICEVLAVHLFSTLVPGHDVVINHDVKERSIDDKCPCGCHCGFKIGPTGIGHQNVWHGSPDLLVKNSAVSIQPLTIVRDDDNKCENEEEFGSDRRKRMKSEYRNDINNFIEDQSSNTSIYSNSFMMQLVSQSLTNGFAQKSKSNIRSQLIPSIGCNLHQLHIFLYNPDDDILMRRKDCLEILSREYPPRLILPSVVELWLILNLPVFGSSMSDVNTERLNKSCFKTFMENENVLKYYNESYVAVGMDELHGRCTPANHNPALMTSDFMLNVLDAVT